MALLPTGFNFPSAAAPYGRPASAIQTNTFPTVSPLQTLPSWPPASGLNSWLPSQPTNTFNPASFQLNIPIGSNGLSGTFPATSPLSGVPGNLNGYPSALSVPPISPPGGYGAPPPLRLPVEWQTNSYNLNTPFPAGTPWGQPPAQSRLPETTPWNQITPPRRLLEADPPWESPMPQRPPAPISSPGWEQYPPESLEPVMSVNQPGPPSPSKPVRYSPEPPADPVMESPGFSPSPSPAFKPSRPAANRLADEMLTEAGPSMASASDNWAVQYADAGRKWIFELLSKNPELEPMLEKAGVREKIENSDDALNQLRNFIQDVLKIIPNRFEEKLQQGAVSKATLEWQPILDRILTWVRTPADPEAAARKPKSLLRKTWDWFWRRRDKKAAEAELSLHDHEKRRWHLPRLPFMKKPEPELEFSPLDVMV